MAARVITAEIPASEALDRTTMNAWEDAQVIARVNAIGKPRLVIAGLWTSVCIVGPVVSAIEQGFEVYVIADACGDVSDEAHERAMQRMIQAGARPMTSLQYLLELQRDWARGETYGLTTVGERHRHRYEVNNAYRAQLEEAGLIVSGESPDRSLVEFVELPRDVHPYYVATQAHPEFRSRPTKAHPLFAGLIAAAVVRQAEVASHAGAPVDAESRSTESGAAEAVTPA